MLGHVFQGPLGRIDERRGVAGLAEVLGNEGLVRGGGGDPEFLDVGQLHGLGLEGLVLPRLRVHGVDLRQRGFQGLGLAEPLALRAAE